MNSDKRRARVKRLKYEILCFMCLMVVVPWALTILLAARNHALKADAEKKEALAGEYLEQLEMLTQEMAVTEGGFEGENAVSESTETKRYTYEGLSQAEIEALELSDEELYDGYRKVYLTFDDGPSSNTDAILDILKEYNVKATFFVIRKDGRENEELYRRIVDEGHTLGMHSSDHVYSSLYASKEAFTEDTENLRNFLYMVTGVEAYVYRFPGGSSNKVSAIPMEEFCKILNDEGIVYYDWNVSSQDAHSPILSKDRIVANATSKLADFNQAVILFHDTASKTTTVQALPEIIEYIQGMDHTVILPITRETNPIQHISVDDNQKQ